MTRQPAIQGDGRDEDRQVRRELEWEMGRYSVAAAIGRLRDEEGLSPAGQFAGHGREARGPRIDLGFR